MCPAAKRHLVRIAPMAYRHTQCLLDMDSHLDSNASRRERGKLALP